MSISQKSVRLFAEREFSESKARGGSWSGPMTDEQRGYREILSGIWRLPFAES